MNRKYAFLAAGFLTALIVIAVLSFSQAIGADAEDPAAVTTTADAGEVAAADFARQLEEALMARESALKSEIANGQAALDALDATSQPKIQALQTQLAATESAINERTDQISTLQTQIAQAEQALQQDDLRYRQDINNMANANLQLRQDLEATLIELQGAYDQIAVQQAASARSDDNSGSSYNDDDDNGGYDDDDDRGGDRDDDDGDDDDDGGDDDD